MLPGTAALTAAAGRAPAPTITLVQEMMKNENGASSYTFSNAQLGTPSPDRHLLAVVNYANAIGARALNSVTLGGQGMTLYKPPGTPNFHTSFGLLPLSAGTTANIVVNLSGSPGYCGVAVFACYGLRQGVIQSIATGGGTGGVSSLSASLALAPGDVLLASSLSSAGTHSYVGVTLLFDTQIEPPNGVSSAGIWAATAAETRAVQVAISPSSASILHLISLR